MNATRQQKLTVEGIVTPAGWDAAGNVTVVSLAAADEAEYVISATGRGRQLLKLIHESVMVCGVLKTGRDGLRVLVVHWYRPLGSEAGRDFDSENMPPTTGAHE